LRIRRLRARERERPASWLEEALTPLGDPRLRFWDEIEQIPPLDLYEEGDEVVVAIDLPGVSKDDVEVSVTGDVLTVRGERTERSEIDEGAYYRREVTSGSFLRSLTLPASADRERGSASFADGVLTIRFPKRREATARKIDVSP
jgi:HSP20 family protein